MWASQTGPKVILSLGVILKVRLSIVPLFGRFLDFLVLLKKLGRCGCLPQSGYPALVPTAPGVIRGRAPGAERCEIFFWLLLGDCASSFLDGTDPSRKGEPQKLGRPLARTASSKGQRICLLGLCCQTLVGDSVSIFASRKY